MIRFCNRFITFCCITAGLAALILLNSCMSSPGKQYYQLHLDVVKQSPIKNKIQKVLMVEKVSVEPVYNDYRVVYRLSPYELNYYSYKFWVKKPDFILRDSIYNYMEKNNLFDKVIKKFAEGSPNLLLKAKINAIEEYDYQSIWYAHLDMEIEIEHFNTGETLLAYNFSRRKMMPQKKVELLPKILSSILEEELGKLVKQLEAKLISMENAKKQPPERE